MQAPSLSPFDHVVNGQLKCLDGCGACMFVASGKGDIDVDVICEH